MLAEEAHEMIPVSEPELSGKRVLVADHEAAIRWTHVGALRSAGARVTEARDGPEALHLARSQKPDLVVADVALPGLGGLELCEALRQEPGLEGMTVILVSDGEPPQAVWDPAPRSKALVEAALGLLAGRVIENSGAPSSSAGPVSPVDPVERENVRAQSTVAMYRDPANRIGGSADSIWRLRGKQASREASTASGFSFEASVISKTLGAAFLALVVGTIALIAWRLISVDDAAVVPQVESEAPAVEAEGAQAEPTDVETREPAAATQSSSRRSGVHAWSGTLHEGVDSALGAVAGQGALELDGPPDIRVTIDGIERGGLPLAIVLDQGIHAVRYGYRGRSTDRFYYVKPGFTRRLVVVTRAGGFVDAR
jgi:CheY-like chemotaxis protein